MSDRFKAPLAVFETELAEVDRTLDYLNVSIRVRATLGRWVDWDKLPKHEKEMFRKFIKLKDFNQKATINGLHIVMVAAFEEYLRSTLREAIAKKTKEASKFSELGERAANRNFRVAGRALARPEDRPDYLHIDIYEIARRLGTCQPNSKNFELNEEILSDLPAITKLEEFLSCIEEFGFDLKWDQIGRSKEVQRQLGTRGTRESVKAVKQELIEAVKTRNRIAHTGMVVGDLTSEGIRRMQGVLREVARGITGKLQIQ